MKAEEYIVASAVRKDGHVFVGERHGDAARWYMKITGSGSPYFGPVEDGFVTSKMRFLGRGEAFKPAKKNGQFKREELGRLAGDTNPAILKELFSEDLW